MALTSAAVFIGLLDSRPDIQHGLLTATLVTAVIVPWALMSLVITMLCLMALLYWARSPDRGVFLKTGWTMCFCATSMALGLLALNHLSGTLRVAGLILFMGIGTAMTMFMWIIIPVWESRGFLRHPKATAGRKEPAERS